jgi:hypothetical protein
MGVVVSSQTGLSIAANSKSTDQITGTYQFVPYDCQLTVYARGSANGVNIQLFVNGQALMNDLPVPFFGTSGALTKNDHEVSSFDIPAGSRIEFFARNTTAGALTVDFNVEIEEFED